MRKTISALIVFFVVFIIYLFTLHPSVAPYRDSGDLIVAAHTIGIAHPPGYPLYALFGKTADVAIPLGNVAYRMNVLSALFGAAAAAIIVLAVASFTGSIFAGIIAALFLAFTPALWRLSQVSEMYSLNALFAAAILWLAVRWGKGSDTAGGALAEPLLYLAAFLGGAGTANHQTIVLIFPGLLWLAWKNNMLTARRLAFMAGFFALGLSVYIFLPVRAQTNPFSNWGKPSSLQQFLRVVTRSDYGGMKLHPEQSAFHWTLAGAAAQIGVYLRSVVEQFSWPGAIVGLVGIFAFRKNRTAQALLIALVLAGPAFILLSNLPPEEKTTLPILEPHLVLPNVVFAFFIGAAFARYGTHIAVRIAAVLLVLVPFALHAGRCDYRSHFYAYDYGKNIGATAEKNGLIYDPDDSTAFIMTYLQTAGKERPDLKLLAYFRTRWGYELIRERFPELLPACEIPSGQELARTLLDHNRARFPVYAELPAKFSEGYVSYPRGLLYRLSAAGEYLPSDAPFALYRMRGGLEAGDGNDFFTNQIISYYAAAYSNYALACTSLGKNDEGRRSYLRSLGIDGRLTAARNNLGILYYTTGDYARAEGWFKDTLALTPDNASLIYNLGLVSKARKDAVSAENYFRDAWNKDYAAAGNELGLLLLGKGNAAGSAGVFEELIRRHADYLPAYFNLGLAYKQLGRYKESRTSFHWYADHSPSPAERADALRIIQSLSTR